MLEKNVMGCLTVLPSPSSLDLKGYDPISGDWEREAGAMEHRLLTVSVLHPEISNSPGQNKTHAVLIIVDPKEVSQPSLFHLRIVSKNYSAVSCLSLLSRPARPALAGRSNWSNSSKTQGFFFPPSKRKNTTLTVLAVTALHVCVEWLVWLSPKGQYHQT